MRARWTALLLLMAVPAFALPQDSRHPGIAVHELLSPVPSPALTSVCPAGATLEGIDVSHWDGAIDWVKVAASGKKFAFAKATEGVTFADNTFATHWAGMKAAGIVRGAYHFFRPASSGTAQADWFLSKVGTLSPGDLPPTLDWEATDGVANADAWAGVQAFVDRIRQRTGQTTILYTSARFLGTVGNPTQFGGLPLWDAWWRSSCPDISDAWAKWTFWQYSATGVVPGITGDVDLNKFNGGEAELKAFTVQAPDAGSDGGADGGGHDGGEPGADGGLADAGVPDAGPDAGPRDGGNGADGPRAVVGGGCASGGSSPPMLIALAFLVLGLRATRPRR